MISKLSQIFLKKSQLSDEQVHSQLISLLNKAKSTVNGLTDFKVSIRDNIFYVMLFVLDETKAKEIYQKVSTMILYQQSKMFVDAMKNRIEISVSSPRGTEDV